MPLFVEPSPPGECIFCRLVAGQIPAARVFEDELTLAFMDIGQVNPGHTLVASKRHAATLFDLTPDEAGAVMQTAQRVAAAVRAATDHEFSEQQWLMKTDDFKEGVKSVNERRVGDFKGR